MRLLFSHLQHDNTDRTHKLFHKADDNGYENTAAVLKEIQGLMDEARALLTDAQDALDKDASSAPGVTVNLV